MTVNRTPETTGAGHLPAPVPDSVPPAPPVAAAGTERRHDGAIPLTPPLPSAAADHPRSAAAPTPVSGERYTAPGADDGTPEPEFPGSQPSAGPESGSSCPAPAPVPAPPPGAETGRAASGPQFPAGSPQDTAGTAERTDAAVPAARTWTIELPAGMKLLGQNDRLHYMERHRRSEVIKKAAWATALKAKPAYLERVNVTLVYDPPNPSRDRDPDNLSPTLKPVIDGITLAGKIGKHIPGRRGSGDDARYVVHAGCEISDQPYPRGRLRVIICEVTA